MFKSRTKAPPMYTSRSMRKMVTSNLYLFLLLPYFLVMCNISSAASAVPPPYFLDCGATSQTTSKDGREWDTDFFPNTSTSATSASSEQSPSVEQIPYSTARIFHSKFTYTFPVSEAGQIFLRLYFYPTNYSNGFDMTKSFFSVHTPNHTLLSNFSASLNLENNSSTLVKEYVIVVNQSRLLEVTFTPNPNSYAFVNGIEVVSIPDKFYIGGNDGSGQGTELVGHKNGFPIDDSMALEKLYRLNVGGTPISPTNDSGMFRSWDADEPYLFGSSLGWTPSLQIPINYTSDTPPYTAPEIVYLSARTLPRKSFGSNLTWFFPVDSGFAYLLRLYFCEFMKEITQSNQRVFSIYINNQTADEKVDVFRLAGGRGIPVYGDYVVIVSENPDGSKSKPDLWLAMHPNMIDSPDYENVILNGLEIFKLSQPRGSLALPNHESGSLPPLENEKPQGGASPLGLGSLGGIIFLKLLGGIILFVLIVGFLLSRRRREKSQDVDTKSRSTNTNISSLPFVRSRKFSLEEIKFGTGNFDDNFVIGRGGFGNVYKAYMQNCTYPVAIKRLNPSSQQGAHEFQTEIMILSNLRHRHLVPLIGCCDDSGEMILVYDYMVHGTLRGHLYGGDNPPLSWKQKLRICIGAARGLHYLHAGAERVIIHRDVKSTNILLDEKMVAKVSDFGLSKMGPSDSSVTHMSTVVKGSFGYLDPEYYLRRQLTTKSDVYSFGVVLFEVLCARPVIMQDLPHEQMSLAEWARNCYRNGNLGEIADKNLTGEMAAESLNKFGEVAYSCLRDRGIDRPTMSDVVSSLEFALQLQESPDKSDHELQVAQTTSGEASTSSTSSDGFKSGIGSVFSDILNLNAR